MMSNEEPRKLKPGESDGMLNAAVVFNDTNPIAYEGVWLPKGTLRKLLAAKGDTGSQE